ncbi:MAG: hypothetical protein ABIO02_02460 [Patescibacteria group bacterium]
MISYSAPISIPFSGEDSALYGKPVLILASDQRVICKIFTGTQSELSPLLQLIIDKVTSSLTQRSIPFEKKSFSYVIESDSFLKHSTSYTSAVIVVSVAALMEFFAGKEQDTETINILSYQIEKEYFHFSLGFFTSSSCFGGIQYFRKEFEFLKNVSRLNFKLPHKIEKRLFIVQGEDLNESAAESVEKIKSIYNQNASKMDSVFSQMEKVTKRMVVAIAQENETMFENCMLEGIQIQSALYSDEFKMKRIGLGQNLYLVYSEEKKIDKTITFPFILSHGGLKRTDY